MIVDTGLHYKGMKRDEAIKMFADKAWDDTDFNAKEVRTSIRYDDDRARFLEFIAWVLEKSLETDYALDVLRSISCATKI